jgi:urate oxidase
MGTVYPEISEVRLSAPNEDYFRYNLSRFGRTDGPDAGPA